MTQLRTLQSPLAWLRSLQTRMAKRKNPNQTNGAALDFQAQLWVAAERLVEANA
jgi:hypothetical protein